MVFSYNRQMSPNLHMVQTSDKNMVYISQQGKIVVIGMIFPMVRRPTKISICTEVAQLQVALEFGRQSDRECCAQLVHRLVILKVVFSYNRQMSPNFHMVETSDKNMIYISQQGKIVVIGMIFPMVRRPTKISIRTEVAQLQVALEFGRQSDRECCAQLVHRLVILKVIGRWASCKHCSCKQLP